MIKTIKLNQEYKLFPLDFVWDNIPRFAVITGLNGAGKTQLLEIFDSAIRNRNLHSCAEVEYHSGINVNSKQKVKFIRFNHNFNNLQTANASHVENSASIFFKYLKNNRTKSPNTSYEKLVDIVENNAGKKIDSLSEIEIEKNLPGDWARYITEGFNNDYIAVLFQSYQTMYNTIVTNKHHKGEHISPEDVYKIIGHPPWEVINTLFKKYEFHYRINAPESNLMSYEPVFSDTYKVSKNIKFNQLSGGEQVIVSLILWAYNDLLSGQNTLFLFDEFDAHLNPSMSKMFIDISKNILVDRFNIQVIITTHNLSTVAYAPDDSLYWLERGKEPRKTSKDEIIPRLADGIATVTEIGIKTRINYTLKTKDEPIVFVEGITDKMILEIAWNKLHSEEKMPFYIQEAFSCHFIINALKREDFFKNYPDRIFIGLLDYDNAYTTWIEKYRASKDNSPGYKKNDQIENVYSHTKEKGHACFLPVPDFRSQYAGNQIKNPIMSIEHLFEDEIISKYCEEITHAGGGKTFKFKNKKKMGFAEKTVPTLEVKQFVHFKPLFEILTNIVKGKIKS